MDYAPIWQILWRLVKKTSLTDHIKDDALAVRYLFCKPPLNQFSVTRQSVLHLRDILIAKLLQIASLDPITLRLIDNYDLSFSTNQSCNATTSDRKGNEIVFYAFLDAC